MTVLVDEARWQWRGRAWAHLVSDRSLEELHGFAAEVGLRRVAFQGDHYDVDVVHRARAIAAGADPVGSRELVRRLRRAGLRLAPSRRPAPWQQLFTAPWPLPSAACAALVGAASEVGFPAEAYRPALDGLAAAALPGAEAVALRRAGDLALLVRVRGPVAVAVPTPVRSTEDGSDTVLELFLSAPDALPAPVG